MRKIRFRNAVIMTNRQVEFLNRGHQRTTKVGARILKKIINIKPNITY